MGVFYTETLLPRLQRWHTYVSLHDVYNPLFWTDAAPTRDMSIYPPDMPNREGAIVLDWLAYPHLADACGLFTAAPAKRGNEPFHRTIYGLRGRAGIGADDLLDPHHGRCPEPTVWFELGCTARAAAAGSIRTSSTSSRSTSTSTGASSSSSWFAFASRDRRHPREHTRSAAHVPLLALV